MLLSEAELWDQGNRAESAGDPAGALQHYAELYQHLKSNAKEAPSLLIERMAECCRAREDYAHAMSLYFVARDGCLQVGDTLGAERLATQLVGVLLQQGRLEEAANCMSRELAVESLDEMRLAVHRRLQVEEPNDLRTGTAWAVVAARFLAATGQYDDAINIARASLRAARQCASALAGELELFLGEVLVDAGRFDEVLAMAPGPSMSPRWMLVVARAERLLGRLGDALKSCQRVRGQPLSPVVGAQATLLESAIYSQLNRVAAAEALLIEGAANEALPAPWRARLTSAAELIGLRRQAASDAQQLPFTIDDLWTVVEPEAGTSHALPNTEAMQGAVSERYADRVARELNSIAIQIARGTVPAVVPPVLRQLREACDSALQKQRLHAGEGAIEYYRARYTDAEAHWREALRLATELRAVPYAWEACVSLSWCAARRGDLRAQEAYARQARQYLENTASALEFAQRRHFLLNKVSARDEYLALEARGIRTRRSHLAWVPWAGDWFQRRMLTGLVRSFIDQAALISQYGVRQELVASENEEFTSVPVTAHQVERLVNQQLELASRKGTSQRSFTLTPHRRLRRGEAIVQYLPLPDQLLVAWTTGSRAGLLSTPITRPELDRTVGEALRAIIDDEDFELPAGTVQEALAALARVLRVSELIELTAARHLIVIPADVLVNLPFVALVLENGQYLVESCAVSLLPNAAWLRTRPPHRERDGDHGVVVGCIEYPERDLAALPKAESEAFEVTSALQSRGLKVENLREVSATRARVTQALQAARVAHFACHGESRSDEPLASCLHFSGDGTPTSDRLTAREVYGMKLALRLAVLAACRASSVTPLPDNDLVGLPAAFLSAGADAVVAPLWDVSDALAGAFMREMHAETQHQVPAIALQRVQRSWCRSKDDVARRPFHWAVYSCFATC